MGLGVEELARLRTETESWFTDLCTIYRVTEVDDNFGGQVESEALHLADVPCMIEPGAAHEQERVLLAKIEGTQLFTITLPAQTDIKVNDNLHVPAKNLTLRVQAVMAPESWEIERRVVASDQGEQE